MNAQQLAEHRPELDHYGGHQTIPCVYGARQANACLSSSIADWAPGLLESMVEASISLR